MRHSTNLDILRALAVTTVLVDHLVPTLHLWTHFNHPSLIAFVSYIGHAGVLAFFVHTSLVLMESMARMHTPLGPLARRFYVRRLFRIYPLAICVTLAAVALHLPSNTWSPPQLPSHLEIAANLLLVQNLVTGQSVVGPQWSLPYEVQMYLVLPLLYILARSRRGVASLWLFLAAGWALGAFAAWRFHHMNMLAYLSCFLCGVLCYALRDRQRPRFPAAAWPIFLLALIAAFAALSIRVSAPWRTEAPAFWLGWIFCLILGLSINLFHDVQSPLLAVPAEKVARYSYGIYLLHVPVMAILFFRLHIQSTTVAVPLFLLLTTLGSILTFHLIESPMINLGRRLSSPTARLPSIPEPVAPAP